MKARWSPGRSPSARRRWASRFDSSSSSRNVMTSPEPAMITAGLSGVSAAICPRCTKPNATRFVSAAEAGRPPYGSRPRSDQPAPVPHEVTSRDLVRLPPGLDPHRPDAVVGVAGEPARFEAGPGREGVAELVRDPREHLGGPLHHDDVPRRADGETDPPGVPQVPAG